ncbi:hypothetical protein HWC35_gp093 [Vibrio phage USC-1]|uniref:Uncharacterized protein n=2 Tax=Aphroditevirus USC1 TaxID=2846605 RepID=A0A514A2H7_9CAUD|nr:hypothetical protein HWC35_gp093 [Vibrio phage USC-1]QCW23241.1 hypothetical protein [Vibrio phage 5 TSL-2019]QDH47487.1 hypothetical protein [Vibrio phage USC-1]
MIREINSSYKDIRKRVRKWEAEVIEFNEKVKELKATLDQPIGYQTLMEMAKFAQALPSEVRELKLYATMQASHVNGDTFRQCVKLRSNNGYISLTQLDQGRALIKEYYHLAENMLKYTLDELNRDRTQTNSHKAVCLSRDVARFQKYFQEGFYGPIEWSKIEPDADYLSNMYSLENVKDDLFELTRRDSTKGLHLWSLTWDTERLQYAIHSLQALVERVTEFGVARLELTPEQLDKLDPK